MNAGLRFDQMWQYVDANQLSPRISFTYKPFEYTTFHAGYARYFTPPVLVEAAPANIALFNGTTGAPASGGTSPVLPERSHYFDAGVDQKIPFGCTSADGERLHHARSRRRRLLQDRNGPDRQRQFRPGAGAQRLQLRQGHHRGHRVQRQIPQRQFPGLCQSCRRPGESDRGGVEPIFVRQRHAACRSRRPDRAAVHRLALDLHRSHPDRDRLGRRLYQFCGRPSCLRDVVDTLCGTSSGRHDLRLRACAPATPISAPKRLMRSSTPASRTNSPCPTASR